VNWTDLYFSFTFSPFYSVWMLRIAFQGFRLQPNGHILCPVFLPVWLNLVRFHIWETANETKVKQNHTTYLNRKLWTGLLTGRSWSRDTRRWEIQWEIVSIHFIINNFTARSSGNDSNLAHNYLQYHRYHNITNGADVETKRNKHEQLLSYRRLFSLQITKFHHGFNVATLTVSMVSWKK